MADENKTKEQLIEELNKLRQYIAELKGFAEEIKQARVNQEKFAKAFLQNSIPVGITTLTEGRFIDVSNAFLKLMGRKREEVVGHTSTDIGFITEEQRVIFFDELNKKGRVENLEMKVRTEGGALRDGLFNAVTMNFNNEEHLLTVVTDISERKRMEETLIESEQRLMQAQAIAHLGSWEIDLKNQMMWASEEAFRIYGIEYTGPASACMPLAEAQKVVHPEDRPGMDGALKALLKENKRYDQEFRIFRVNDGELRVIHSRADILFSGTRHPVKVFGTLQDITDRKQAEEALRESEEKYRYITERMSDAIWTLDSNFRVQYVSPSVLKALGFTPEERTKQTIFERITPESFKKVEEVLKFELQRDRNSDVDRDRAVTLELEYYHKNGSTVWHETVVSSIRDAEGNIIGFHGASRDITKRKKIEKERTILQERLRRAEKLESIGTLAGGIAHDFNNILSAIIGYTEMAIQETDKNSPLRRYLHHVFTAAERARDLVKQILAFSRQSEERPRPLRVGPIIKELLKLLRASLPSTIKIRQEIQSELDTVLADPTQIHQILMNLCTNAAYAMQGEKGELKISLVPVNVEASDNLIIQHDLFPGKYLRLTVSDTGAGIEGEIMDRIFDPFFTTKKPGEGTGLGLSVVYGIVKSYSGAITVESGVGKGTEFNVYLPLLTEAEDKKEAKVEAPIPGGKERILFVDDEAPLVQLATGTLTGLGYEVVGRTGSMEALELFRARPDSFDLVITDMTMPNMTGSELAQQLMRIRPDIPIILCTGFSEAMTQEKARAMGVKDFIMKPIVQRQMAEAIRRVLDDKG